MARSHKGRAVGNALLVGVGAVVFLQMLASQPNCDRGCKNVLQHLTEHVLGDMLTNLLRA
jgi:hypothetical protein